MISLNYVFAMMLIALGFYCLLLKRNLIKMIIGLGVMTDGIHLFLISMGFREGGIAPIATAEILQGNAAATLAGAAVDPVPQALVLTSIVINICITAMALSMAIWIYHYHKTLDPYEIRRLRE